MAHRTGIARRVRMDQVPLPVVSIEVPVALVTWALIAFTAQNLKVVMVDAERNLIGVNGAVPGGKGSLVVFNENA